MKSREDSTKTYCSIGWGTKMNKYTVFEKNKERKFIAKEMAAVITLLGKELREPCAIVKETRESMDEEDLAVESMLLDAGCPVAEVGKE
jgi:hypothetical protein